VLVRGIYYAIRMLYRAWMSDRVSSAVASRASNPAGRARSVTIRLVNRSFFDYNRSTIDSHPLWHLDKPTAADANGGRHTLDITGWIAAVGAIDTIRLVGQGRFPSHGTPAAARPDVESLVGFESRWF